MNKQYYDGYLINFSSSNGYPTIWKNNKNILLHRYVWEKYFGEIPNNCEIHHKDKNRKNYNLSNLKLVSKKEHHREHAIENKLGIYNRGKTKDYVSGFCSRRREIYGYKENQKLYFSSIYKASKQLNIPHTSISRVLKGDRKTTKGWRFEYVSS